MYKLRNKLMYLESEMHSDTVLWNPKKSLDKYEKEIQQKYPDYADRLLLDREAVNDEEALAHLKHQLFLIIESMSPKVSIIKNGKAIATGSPADIRETVEDLLMKKLGLYVSLQENDPLQDDCQYILYVYSESYDDFDGEDIQLLEQTGIYEDAPCTAAICKYLGIYFRVR